VGWRWREAADDAFAGMLLPKIFRPCDLNVHFRGYKGHDDGIPTLHLLPSVPSQLLSSPQ
jgi:hypothetical protein